VAGSDNSLLEAVLDAIEERESKLLVWGLVDGCFNSSELDQVIDPLLDASLEAGQATYFESRSVVNALLNLRWLVKVLRYDGAEAYRSRMAETVRLALRLRQLFPKHARTPNGWQVAPTLVADFRFQRRRRTYPRRDIPVDVAIRTVHASTADPLLKAAINSILNASEQLRNSGLAGFQVRSTVRLIRAIESGEPLSTIVCAGTGSGKTLAFYLPALASIVRHRLADQSPLPWVKVISIYPRTELLKDQLREVLSRARSIPSKIQGIECARIRVGALYGDVPSSSGQNMSWPKGWTKRGTSRICPSLQCLECDSQLLWAETDFVGGRERLECGAGCGFTIDGSEFPLTRSSLAKHPPDVLLTTTEMVNRRLSDSHLGHLFGVGKNVSRVPDLVLLDEAHTYEGRHGAQVAYLLRRWRRLVDQPLRFVGLSATLREASSFFSVLTGVRSNLVEEISPKQDELIAEGAEYLLALRGDPVSRSALLSTTIQAALLLQRCLDPRVDAGGRPVVSDLFGKRSFIFTDDLDVTNRLYFNLLDAEGRNSRGQPNLLRAPGGGLASLRREGVSERRYHAGQDWRTCEQLGHDLTARLSVDRVSSQDRGVSAEAELIVATAALEVGFDDPSVGAVIQHKAPRGVAGFLQRKGRAGRTRGMRPWMVVVLSDYGRDRVAYQNYDLLFDPELPVRTLPLANRYIGRIQAAYATMDFLGQKLQNERQGSVWRDLAGPPWSRDRGVRLEREIRIILETESGTKRLADYLRTALSVDDEAVSALLWEYPRPVMTVVLPTALRRLSSEWSAHGSRGADTMVRDNPLPEFVPASLFADLTLTEVSIQLPLGARARDDEPPGMPIYSALREFAPGRVSRRFGVRHRGERYWVAPPPDALATGARADLDVTAIGDVAMIGSFGVVTARCEESIPVYRPLTVNPSTPPANIGDTSNARLLWKTQLVPRGTPAWLDPPTESVWRSLFGRIGFFLHSQHAPVEVRRFAVGSVGDVGVGPGNRQRVEVQFTHEGLAAGLGASFSADGVVLQLSVPKDLHQIRPNDHAVWRALRSVRFLDEARRGVTLSGIANPFQREWLAQIQLSAVTFEAIQNGSTLEVAARVVAGGLSQVKLSDVLTVLFQSQMVEVQNDDVELTGDDRLRRDLNTLLSDGAVLQQMAQASVCLYDPVDETWQEWLATTFHSTVAAGVLRAISDLCPTLDIEDLVVDLTRGAGIETDDKCPVSPNTTEIWITESGPGGNGLIEEFMRNYSDDPRRFYSMIRSALDMGEFEHIDHQTIKLLNLLTNDASKSGTAQTVQKIRGAASHGEMAALSRQLRSTMVREGLSPFHGFLVSVGNRLLRPGAGPSVDQYLARAIERWNNEEARLGIEIDMRVFCFWLAQSSDIDAIALEADLPAGTDHGSWRMNAIYGLLWARGHAMRQAPLQMRSPFSDLPPIERLLVVEALQNDRKVVAIQDGDWLVAAASHLASGHMVTLSAPDGARGALSRALEALICNPIETDYLRGYARLQGVRVREGSVEADVELVEAVQ
jgi:hypothetical protein